VFTGIVQEQGTLASRQDFDGDARLDVAVSAALYERAGVGGSVAVNGVCLTVTERRQNQLLFDVSAETLSATRLGALAPGAPLNLETALSASDPVGGHFVTGHVDGVGEVTRVEEDGRSWRVEVQAPEALSRYIAPKGCITVDGVSLTVNEVNGARFGFNLVPHTLSATIVQHYAAGTRVNLEVDLIARYLERLLGNREAGPQEDDITKDFLSKQGFTPPVVDDEHRKTEENAEDHPPDRHMDDPGPV